MFCFLFLLKNDAAFAQFKDFGHRLRLFVYSHVFLNPVGSNDRGCENHDGA